MNPSQSTSLQLTDSLAEIIDDFVTTRSHICYLGVDRAVYTQVMHDALWSSSVWPSLRVSILWCDKSVPEITFTNAWYVANQLQENWPEGARKVDIVRFHGANHFVSHLLPCACLLTVSMFTGSLGHTGAYGRASSRVGVIAILYQRLLPLASYVVTIVDFLPFLLPMYPTYVAYAPHGHDVALSPSYSL